MTTLQLTFVAIWGTCMLYFMSDALRERRILAWLEGVLVRNMGEEGREGGKEGGREVKTRLESGRVAMHELFELS